MKRNIILKELIGAPDKENDEDFDDNIFKGDDAYKDVNTELLDEDHDDYGDIGRGNLRTSAPLDEDLNEAYQGKAVSRQRAFKNYVNSIDADDEEIESGSEGESGDTSGDEDEDTEDWNIGGKSSASRGVAWADEDDDEDEDDIDEDGGGEQGDDEEMDEKGMSDASSIEDDLGSDNERKSVDKDFVVYSKGVKKETDEKKKGGAILKQQELWETLLENRIVLQKCLLAANKLPVHEEFPDFQAACGNEFKDKMNNCCDKLCQVLEKLLKFQNKLIDACPDYKRKRKNHLGPNEESGDQTPFKKQKLKVYENSLSDVHEDFKDYRDTEIQKWNDRTKISSGKFATSNFSAFDQPTLKQIEQILSDKPRLIRRTQTKRTKYRICSLQSRDQEEEDEEGINPEIFDDSDFYHKLLRDLIERKSGEVTDPTRLGNQWIQLQKLSSRMKKKVDTRASKGRKLRFVVHPKLVNFMSPIESEGINEEATKELYSSLFGKFKV
nr:PREDICTED: protein AATF [Bemisia tabaci]